MPVEQPIFLYVEDDIASREVMEVLLKEVMGFNRLMLFDSSANFIDHLDDLSAIPDVIFLDVHLKPYDGCQLFEMLRGLEKFAKTTIVAITASVMSNEVERLRETGFKHLIGKPINPVAFPAKVTKILSGEEVWDVNWD